MPIHEWIEHPLWPEPQAGAGSQAIRKLITGLLVIVFPLAVAAVLLFATKF